MLPYVKAVYKDRQSCGHVPATATMRLQGRPDAWVDISWLDARSTVVLAFRVRPLISIPLQNGAIGITFSSIWLHGSSMTELGRWHS